MTMTRQELRSYWHEQLAAQAASGCSGRAWCEREGLSYSTFLRWRRRLGETPTPRSVPLTFIPVRRDAPAGPALVVTVGAARIEVPAAVDPDLLRQGVAALAGVG
jgi:hypothetical protein